MCSTFSDRFALVIKTQSNLGFYFVNFRDRNHNSISVYKEGLWTVLHQNVKWTCNTKICMFEWSKVWIRTLWNSSHNYLHHPAIYHLRLLSFLFFSISSPCVLVIIGSIQRIISYYLGSAALNNFEPVLLSP